MSRRTPIILVLMSGVLLFLDRWWKWKAINAVGFPLTDRVIAWEPFLNKGIAFGIELPVPLIVIVTLGIVAAVLYLVYYHVKISPQSARSSVYYGLTLIITGAVSNLVDRVYYGSTIDYLKIYLSVVNLADCCIVVGFFIYFTSLKHLK